MKAGTANRVQRYGRFHSLQKNPGCGGEGFQTFARPFGLVCPHRERLVVLAGGLFFFICFHVGDHFVGAVERPEGTARLDVGQAFSEAGINDEALRRNIFVIGIWKLRAINYHFGRDHDLPALIRNSTASPFASPACSGTWVGRVTWPLF